MREFRFPAIVLSGFVVSAAVSVLLVGPVAWWIAPADLGQLSPLDQVRVMSGIRGLLIQILALAGIIGLITYASVLQVRSVRRRRQHEDAR